MNGSMKPGSSKDSETTIRLKADIDTGQKGDIWRGFDPAAPPLGTDEEAAGTPPSSMPWRRIGDRKFL